LTNAPIVATNRFRKNNNLGSKTNDHGNARLSLSAGPPAGADEAVRYADAETVGKGEKKWTAFQSDPDWIAGRAKSEEDGQIIDNIVSQLLVPTAFSAVK
jgi:hypothetical protein